MALKRGGGAQGNYFDAATGAEYWVSGVRKRGSNRHWAGSGKILVDAAVVPELTQLLGVDALDAAVFAVTHDIKPTRAADFVARENTPLPRQ